MNISALPAGVLYVSIAVNLILLLLVVFLAILKSKQSPDNEIGVLSGELRQLNDLFLAPKLRGGLGERFLYQLLEDSVPAKYWDKQYRFSSGAIVDAVIRLGKYLIPIDSKFPREGVKRIIDEPQLKNQLQATKEIRTHIDSIKEKYIRPEEGTLQFALMYIPSEGIYHSLFVEEPPALFDYALKAHVIPVSPGNLFIYLQTVAYGLQGLSLSEKGDEILKTVSQISIEYNECRKLIDKTEQHAKNMNNALSEASARIDRLGTRITRLSQLDP